MTEPPPPPKPSRTGAATPANEDTAIGDAGPTVAVVPDSAEQLAALRRQQALLRATDATPEQRASALDRLYARGMNVAETLLTSLTASAIAIPIPRGTRLQVRTAQQLLRTLAEDYQLTLDTLPPLPAQREFRGRVLWRGMRALTQHLLLSDLIAAPGGVGIWKQLHQFYCDARAAGASDYADHADHAGDGEAATIHNAYFSAVLLGCAQPASFTSPEIAFIAAYLARHADEIELRNDAAPADPATFWIDPNGDAPACARARKSAPPQTPVLHFSCSKLAARLAQEISGLERGVAAQELGLPNFAGTSTGQHILRRLALHWGEPSKRRFPRRRQNYRALMLCGLARLWRLYQSGEAETGDASHWMITNESPDGYAFMHVAGKTSGLSVGDIVAIRTESGTSWQVCIVRWALSENQEHLELGLQILATRAQPARLGLSAKDDNPTLLSVLVLPAVGALRTREMLVIPTSAIKRLPAKLILVVENGNIELREVRCHHIEEQNSRVALLAIEPDPLPR